MGYETVQSERFFAKVESAFDDTTYTEFLAADAVLLGSMTFAKKLNRTVSPQRSGTPDELVSQDARHTVTWSANGEWAPSGSIGTPSDYNVLLTALMGSMHTTNLVTTVLSGGAKSGAVLTAQTGLQVGDVVVVTTATGREPTRIKTMALLGQTPPTACTGTLAGAGAGNVTAGTHSYKVTFVNASGQTQLGAVSNTVTVADAGVDGKVALTAIPTGPVGTTARKVYRSEAGAHATGPWKLLSNGTIADNTTVILTDNDADGSLGATIANTVTWDDLTAIPANGNAVVSGTTYTLTTARPSSMALGIHETVEDIEEAISGAMIQTATITLLDAGKPTLALTGEAAQYYTTGITTPASATNAEVEITGMVGGVYVNDAAFTANQVAITFGQGAKMMNRGIGVAAPADYIRNAKRTVRVAVSYYRDDEALATLAAAVTRSTLRTIIGSTNGAMLGAVLPFVEYEYPDMVEDDGIRSATINGIGFGDITGTFPNYSLALFEA